MQRIAPDMKQKAGELLKTGAVNMAVAWAKGDLPYDTTPAFFQTPDTLDNMVYSGFCGTNLSKYLIALQQQQIQNKNDGKTLIFLKPCDTYSLNQLLAENRADREKIHVVGVGCDGMIDIEKLRSKGFKGIIEINEDGSNLKIKTMYGDETCSRQEALLEKCFNCKGKEHKIYDELIGADTSSEIEPSDRFSKITELEGKTSDERFSFWRGELSKCIRCNACRNTCPACSCLKCVFDNAASGVNAKSNANEFEENMYHIIRAFHVAGRCSDCGECTRVCPQGIPLHLLNRKFIKDMNNFYGEFQAGEKAELCSPLLSYGLTDAEPNVISKGEGK
jgi:ferredoxin